jgi:hypothetical protein
MQGLDRYQSLLGGHKAGGNPPCSRPGGAASMRARQLVLLAPWLLLAACQGPNAKAGEEKDKATAEAAGQTYKGDGPNERIGQAQDRAADAADDARNARADALHKQAEEIKAQADVEAGRLDQQAKALRERAKQQAEPLEAQAKLIREQK